VEWFGRCSCPRQRSKLARGANDEEHAMSQNLNSAVAVIGIDIGKNSFHIVGLDSRGAIVLRQKWSRGQVEARLANMPQCLIGMEACVGAHHLSRKLKTFGHDARLMPAKYVRPYSKGQKNDFRDAEAIAEAVQRPTMKFVATKTADQLDLQALHRVRERLVSQRTGIINQIRAFLLERGIAVRQGQRFLRAELPRILATSPDVLSARMVRVIEDLADDWRRLDERVEGLSSEIESVARQDAGCERLMSVPGIGPIISSAMVAAIGSGEVFSQGRDFGAWLGLVPKQISTGDRSILGKISKRGNRYLRVLFVQAAWVVLIKPKSWERHGLKPWIEAAKKRLHRNVLAIALANKLARIAWSVLARGRAFEARTNTNATAQAV
jgi:transposase